MTDRWSAAVRRAMDFRARVGEERFADVAFASLQTDPISALAASYDSIGLELSEESRAAVARWALQHEPGSHGSHSYTLSDFGIDADEVREKFAPYIAAFDATG
jgi:hypothetical protein